MLVLENEDILGEESIVPLVTGDDPIDERVVEETSVIVDPAIESDVSLEQKNWLSDLNKEFGLDYKTVDELKLKLTGRVSDSDKGNQGDELELLKAKHERLIEEYKKNDPSNYFSNEFELKKNILMKSNKSLSGVAVDKLLSVDLEKADPLDIIAINLMTKHKSLVSGEAAKAYFKSQNGIDADYDMNDLSETQIMTINIAAEDAARNIVEVRDGIKIPDQKNVDDFLAEVSLNKQQDYDVSVWGDKFKGLVDSIKEIEISDGQNVFYTEPIDNEFKVGLADVIKEMIVKERIDPTPENIALMKKEALDIYFLENKTSIIKKAIAQTETRMKADLHQSIHNDQDPDKAKVVVPTTGKTSNLLKIFGLPQ